MRLNFFYRIDSCWNWYLIIEILKRKRKIFWLAVATQIHKSWKKWHFSKKNVIRKFCRVTKVKFASGPRQRPRLPGWFGAWSFSWASSPPPSSSTAASRRGRTTPSSRPSCRSPSRRLSFRPSLSVLWTIQGKKYWPNHRFPTWGTRTPLGTW